MESVNNFLLKKKLICRHCHYWIISHIFEENHYILILMIISHIFEENHYIFFFYFNFNKLPFAVYSI